MRAAAAWCGAAACWRSAATLAAAACLLMPAAQPACMAWSEAAKRALPQPLQTGCSKPGVMQLHASTVLPVWHTPTLPQCFHCRKHPDSFPRLMVVRASAEFVPPSTSGSKLDNNSTVLFSTYTPRKGPGLTLSSDGALSRMQPNNLTPRPPPLFVRTERAAAKHARPPRRRRPHSQLPSPCPSPRGSPSVGS